MDAMNSAEPTGTSPETGGEAPHSSESSATPANSGATASELHDLEKLERFKFDGRETTYKDLKSAYMRNEDYTRKTQELSQERNYYDNLNADLARVRSNPELATKFREIYPEKFHAYLDYVSQKQSEAPAAKGADTQPALDPKLISRIDQIEKMVTEDKVTAIEAKLEAQDQRMAAKYAMASIKAVYADAQEMHKKGTKLTEEVWERLWRDNHEEHSKRYEAHYKNQVEKQKEANSRSKDTGAGGGIPGQAPQRVALKDVGEHYIKSSQSS